MAKSARDAADKVADKLGGMAGKAADAIKRRRNRTQDRLKALKSTIQRARDAQTTDSNNR